MSKEDDEMKLPEGKTCEDCFHLYKCTQLFNVTITNTVCDFYPSRFFELAQSKEGEL